MMNKKNSSRLHWWFRLTAPDGADDYTEQKSHKEREYLRRAGLTSIIAPLIFLAPLIMLQQALHDIGTAIALVTLSIIALLALLLNKQGKQVFAAALLIISLEGSIEGALLTASGGLGVGWLQTFDLFILPLMFVAILFSRKSIWFFIVLHIGLILGDFYLLPHTADLTALIHTWNSPTIAFARPILVQLVGGFLSFIEVHSTDEAIERAGRAEEINSLQRSIATEKAQLELGIKEIQQSITQAANGHASIRTNLPQDNVLWQIGSSLNTLFARLNHARQNEVVVRQTETDLRRLAEAMYETRMGRSAVWPLPSGGPADPVIKEARATAGITAPPMQERRQ